MLNENSENRAKTTNSHIRHNSKSYQVPQSNNFRDIYINHSPTYYNKQYRYEQEKKNPYQKQFQYLQRQKGPEDYYIEEDNLEKTMKLKLKPDYFFNEFNSMNKSMEKANNYVERSVNTFTNKSPSKLGEKYYIINNKNKNESQNDRQILTYKEYGHQSYKGERIPQKFYRNGPLYQTSNYNSNIKIETENSGQPVAQKICNITIKGGIKKERGKKFKSGKKKHKRNYMENLVFEGNVPQANANTNAIPDKNINFNISATKSKLSSSSANYNDDENYEESENEEIENEEIEEKEEEIPNTEERKLIEMTNKQKTNKKRLFQKDGEENNEEYEEEDDENLRNGEAINKERDTLGEEQEIEGEGEGEGEGYNDNDEEIEVEEEGEQDEGTEQDDNKITERGEKQEIEIEEGTDQNEDEQIEQVEQIEQLEDDDDENNEQMNENDVIRNRIKVTKGDIEELEDEEQQINELTNNTIKENENENRKDDDLNLQKENENEIKLEGKENIFINDKNNNSNNKKLNNTEIKIQKKPMHLVINEESKIELLKNQKFGQANSNNNSNNKNKIYKKQIFNNIIKNKENNNNIINEEEKKRDSLYQMQKIQNFVQPRDRIRKIKNQNQSIKYKIIKYKDSNFMLEKIYEEPELIIENVLFYEQYPNKKPKNRKKNRFTKIKIVKNKDGVLELLGNSVLSICNENNFFIPKIYNKRAYKKFNYNKFKQSKKMIYQYKPIEVINDAIISPKESRFMIKGKPKKMNKKGRNIIKREIIYFYKSPISQNNKLSIGGNISNAIYSSTSNSINSNLNINNELRNQSRFLNKNIIYNRKMQSESNANNTYNTNNNANNNTNNNSNINKNSKPNLFNVYVSKRSNIAEKKEEKKEEYKRSNVAEKKEEKKEEYKRREKNRTYKTTTIVSSNLEKNENETEPVKQEYISIRRKYTNSRSNKNILVEQPENKKVNRFFRRSPGLHPPSSNDCSKDKEINTESNNNKILRYTVGKTKTSITNFMSPKRNEDINSSENKNDNNKVIIGRNNIIISKYEQYNKNQIIQSENSNIGKIRPYFSNKNKNEAPKTPLTKENNDNNNNYYNNNNRSYYNNYRNKSHTITIFSNKQESNNVGRTYISSNKNLKRNSSNEKEKNENQNNNNNTNIERIYVSTTYNFKKTNNNHQIENQKLGTNIINSLYTSKNLKKEKNEDKIDKADKKEKKDNIDKIEIKTENKNKNDNKELSNNSVFYSSFTTKKHEPKHFNNNQIFISSKSTTSNIKNLKDKENDKDKEKGENKENDNKNEIKININRILANSSDNSPSLIKSVDSLSPKPDANNMNKIFNNNTFFSSNIETKNKNIFEKEKNIENEKIIDNINDNNEKDLIKTTPNKEIKKEDKNDEIREKTPEKNNNDNISNFISNDNEVKNEENINIFDKFNYGNNSQLSDFSKNYLNNYMSTSRPELSDFSKQFLTSNYTSNLTNRPELSNITRAYLISRSPVIENDDNK